MSGPLCKYSDALGKPGKGIHKFRVGGLAAADLVLTGALAALISRKGFHTKSVIALLFVFVILLVIAVALHEAFCVKTQLNAWIFGRPFTPNN